MPTTRYASRSDARHALQTQFGDDSWYQIDNDLRQHGADLEYEEPGTGRAFIRSLLRRMTRRNNARLLAAVAVTCYAHRFVIDDIDARGELMRVAKLLEELSVELERRANDGKVTQLKGTPRTLPLDNKPTSLAWAHGILVGRRELDVEEDLHPQMTSAIEALAYVVRTTKKADA
jgi:hypothetical protein